MSKTAEEYVGINSLAGNRTAGLLDPNSILMKKASGVSNQYSNARGLLNSSMANEGALSAMANVAADLGKHEASTYGAAQQASQQSDYNKQLSAQNYRQASNLSGQAFLQDAERARQDYEHNKAINWQQKDYASNLSSQNFMQQAGLLGQGFMQNAELSRQGFAQNKNLSDQQYNQNKDLSQQQIDASFKQQLSNTIASQSNVLMSNIGNLLQNTDIEMGDNVTKWMSDFMYESWQTAASLFGLDIQVV